MNKRYNNIAGTTHTVMNMLLPLLFISDTCPFFCQYRMAKALMPGSVYIVSIRDLYTVIPYTKPN